MMYKKAAMSLFFVNVLTGASFTWDVFFGSDFLSSFDVWSKHPYIFKNENLDYLVLKYYL